MMDDKSKLEKISGSLPANIGGTLLAAFSGTPLTALLPVLTSALASGRHRQRVEKAINEISSQLEQQSEKLKDLTDGQYKVVNESVMAIFQTLEEKKLRYLQNVIQNIIDDVSVDDQQAALISRLVRDLSASEAKFLIDHHRTARFMLSENPPSDSEALHIIPDSDQGLIASGLVSLGLLVSAEPTWDDTGRLRFAPIVKKLVPLLNESETST